MVYPMCNMTVTLYRKTGDSVRREVLHGCYYEWQLQCSRDATGLKKDRKFLLVIPDGRGEVLIGDRVIVGVGPERVDWNRFVPAAVAGLGQVAYVRPYYLEGKLTHTEAGRK